MVKCYSFFDNQIGIGWKLGLKNISRRRGESILHLVVFGLSLMALMVLTETRSDLINSWKQSLSEETPNHFFFNIQSSELDGIADQIGQHLAQPAGIAAQMQRHVRVDQAGQFQAPLLGAHRENVVHVVQRRAQIEVGLLQRQFQ
jgi:predicted ferric reductase